MKKLVSIGLTTGLLMGTVAFSAMACDQDGNCPDKFQEQKQMGQHERYQPSMGPQRQRGRVMVKVEDNGPCPPPPAPMVRKPGPGPAQELDHRMLPQPGRPDHDWRPAPEQERNHRMLPQPKPQQTQPQPGRPAHNWQPVPERNGVHCRPVPEKLGWDGDF